MPRNRPNDSVTHQGRITISSTEAARQAEEARERARSEMQQRIRAQREQRELEAMERGRWLDYAQTVPAAPEIPEADPELERLLAEEEAIERAMRDSQAELARTWTDVSGSTTDVGRETRDRIAREIMDQYARPNDEAVESAWDDYFDVADEDDEEDLEVVPTTPAPGTVRYLPAGNYGATTVSNATFTINMEPVTPSPAAVSRLSRMARPGRRNRRQIDIDTITEEPMPDNLALGTFGFELEFQEFAAETVHALHNEDDEMIRMDHLHRYHCSCEECEFNNGAALRAQTDSSCSGEIISDIFSDIDQARPVFEAIQKASLDVDSTPGMSAGLHVHVGARRVNRTTLADAHFEWLRWEPTYEWLARGRFSTLRPFNTPVRKALAPALTNGNALPGYDVPWELVRDPWGTPEFHWPELWEYAANDDSPTASIKEQLWMYHHGNIDRHAALCVNTRHNTWEVRIWNSTRSAWRMELFTQLSRLILQPRYVNALREYEPDPDSHRIRNGKRPQVEFLISTIGEHDERTAELLTRQYEYLKKVDSGDVFPTDSFSMV